MTVYTHFDLDGVVSAVIFLKVRPELLEGKITTLSNEEFNMKKDYDKEDIVLDMPLPLDEISFWADHHKSNEDGVDRCECEFVFDAKYKSCAELMYDYFIEDNPELKKIRDLVLATSKIDSGNLEIEDIVNPKGASVISLALRSGDRDSDVLIQEKIIRKMA